MANHPKDSIEGMPCMRMLRIPHSVSLSARWPSRTRADVPAGVLAVVRSTRAQDKPYTGLTEIKSGEVAEDLAGYLADSEQTSSALALGVSIHRDAAIRAAGGYLIQVRWCTWR